MFNTMKLGTKIVLGFAALLAIATVIGGIAIWNMKSVESHADVLAHEFVPEVDLSTKVDQATVAALLEIRAYQYTSDEQCLERATKHIADVKKYLDECQALAASSAHLPVLKESVVKAQAKFSDWNRLIAQTATLEREMTAAKETLNKEAQVFSASCDAFKQSQAERLKTDLDDHASEERLKERFQKIALIGEIIDNVNACRVTVWKAQAQRDIKLIDETSKKFAELEKSFAALRAITHMANDIKALDEADKAMNDYHAALTDLQAKWQTAETVSLERRNVSGEMQTLVRANVTAGSKHTLETAETTSASLAVAASTMIGGLLVALIVGMLLAFFITRGITHSLQSIITGLRASAEQVASAANQVSQSSQSMAEGASQQASSLEETSASLEEMASMTRQNADNASQARANSDQASSAAESGQSTTRKMGQELTSRIGGMNDAIQKIKTSADQTAKILKTIDEIAFQTNLLALNAAVEAARAGEAGKGFAVVAEEVRNLAQRSADAAKSTAALIEESQRNADNGVKVSSEVSEILKRAVEVEIARSFGNTVEAANKVKQLIGEVAAASGEQAKGVDQINTAVSEMDKVTQSNAANAEETASASEELSAQSRELQEMVNALVTLVSGAGAVATAQDHRSPVRQMMVQAAAAPRPKQAAKAAAPAASTHTGVNRVAALNGAYKNGAHKNGKASTVIPLSDEELSSF